MPKEEIIWKHKKAVDLYHKTVFLEASGVFDEKYVKNYISKRKNIKVVSLGIGSGRELSWLHKLKNIKEITGIDYSSEFLSICREVAKRYKAKVTLIKDNFFSFKKFKKFIKKEKLSLIYVCLLNTLGNFTSKQREKVLTNVRDLMKKKDRTILCLYKRPERIKAKIILPKQIRLEGGIVERIKLGTVLEFSKLELLWLPILEKFRQIPRFWYDDKNNNVTIYVGKKKILISHRFSKEEIIGIAKKTKLKIEKLIEGKFMWVVILKV